MIKIDAMLMRRLCGRGWCPLSDKRLTLLPMLSTSKSRARSRSRAVSSQRDTDVRKLDLCMSASVTWRWDVTSGEDTLVDLPKNFDAAEVEEKIYRWWEESGFFEPKDMGDCFVISMPPPNVTGRLHMGHAMGTAIQDMMIRFARMRGQAALYVPGTDHAGIATQMVVERMLNEQGMQRQSLGREKFEEAIWEWKAQYGGCIAQQLRRLGASCDWSRERFTLDSSLSVAVNEAFVRLYEKGHIYKGSYLVNWSPSLQTAVSDLEVDYSEEQGILFTFRYPLVDGKGYIPVATTRPETILGDTAVAVHPSDDRYKHLVGQRCLVPSIGREIPIVADDYVDMEFGTGALKITPGHDPNDYIIGRRLKLDVINIMNKDATLNDNACQYSGMDRFEARAQLWKDIEAAGLSIKTEAYTMRVPRSQRGGEIIEPLISKQWFVKMATLAEPALEAVKTGDVQIVPSHFTQIFNNWLENIEDWCISRQLWWGHRIPVWYVQSENGNEEDIVVARSYKEAIEKAKVVYGPSVQLRQEDDVLDTWFSSGLWPFSTLGWPDVTQRDYCRFYPTQMMETGHDILFFWIARMIMMGIECTGKPPFDKVYLHGLVRDEQGRKMSKSLGNVIDPLDVVSKHGADPLRYMMVTGIATGQDLNLNPEKFTSARYFTNKLWNIGKFVGRNLPTDVTKLQTLAKADFSNRSHLMGLPLTERWIVSRLHQTINRTTELQERFDLSEAGRELYEFIWFDFADWYVEAAKTRLTDASDDHLKNQSQSVLVYCLDRILKMMHPITPFITERLWQAMPHNGQALITAQWPTTNGAVDEGSLIDFVLLQSIVRSIRNARAEYNVNPFRSIPGTIVVPDPELIEALKQEASVIVLLARVSGDGLEFVPSLESAASGDEVVTLVVKKDIEVVLPMSGLFDPVKELERLEKQKMKIQKELDGLEARLKNGNFVEKAPTAVVDEVRSKAASAMAQLEQITAKISQLSK